MDVKDATQAIRIITMGPMTKTAGSLGIQAVRAAIGTKADLTMQMCGGALAGPSTLQPFWSTP
jgi:hypothetical protein